MIWTVILSLMPSVGPQVYLIWGHLQEYILWHISSTKIIVIIVNFQFNRKYSWNKIIPSISISQFHCKKIQKAPSTMLHPSPFYEKTRLKNLQYFYIISNIYRVFSWYLISGIAFTNTISYIKYCFYKYNIWYLKLLLKIDSNSMVLLQRRTKLKQNEQWLFKVFW